MPLKSGERTWFGESLDICREENWFQKRQNEQSKPFSCLCWGSTVNILTFFLREHSAKDKTKMRWNQHLRQQFWSRNQPDHLPGPFLGHEAISRTIFFPRTAKDKQQEFGNFLLQKKKWSLCIPPGPFSLQGGLNRSYLFLTTKKGKALSLKDSAAKIQEIRGKVKQMKFYLLSFRTFWSTWRALPWRALSWPGLLLEKIQRIRIKSWKDCQFKSLQIQIMFQTQNLQEAPEPTWKYFPVSELSLGWAVPTFVSWHQEARCQTLHLRRLRLWKHQLARSFSCV